MTTMEIGMLAFIVLVAGAFLALFIFDSRSDDEK